MFFSSGGAIHVARVAPDELAEVLEDVRRGTPGAGDRLAEAIYPELRRLAGRLMRRERRGHTLSPSDLAHEALVRLLGDGVLADPSNRGYLFSAAASAMRRVLVEHHRRRNSLKRNGRWQRTFLEESLAQVEARGYDLLALDEALDRLAARNARQCLVVTCHYFLGMTIPEVAEALEVSPATVNGDWRLARAWLLGQLRGEDE
jgi:RNA polymerase sigma factor (TIGR02999 family)